MNRQMTDEEMLKKYNQADKECEKKGNDTDDSRP